MPDKPQIITPAQAKKQGYHSLTYAMTPSEQWILDSITENLAKGNIPFVLVETSYGIEVWRKPKHL